MAAYLQVVLQESMPNLGKSGEVVRVRPGYARNFLLPRRLAAYATERNIAKLEHDKREAQARASKLKGEFEALAARLSGVTVKLERTVGAEDRMYGSVTSKDVAAALAEQQTLTIDRRKIELPAAIKALGTYDAAVRLSQEVTASFKVEVTRAG